MIPPVLTSPLRAEVDVLRTTASLDRKRNDAASTRTLPRTTVVSLVGEHDISTADALEHRIEQQLDRCDRLVVDLSQVTFMDSGTVRAVLRAALVARARGLVFEVVSSRESETCRLLEMLGLMGYFALREPESSPASSSYE